MLFVGSCSFFYYAAPFSCAGKTDGFYPDSSDCSKYYMCYGGVTFEKYCPPDLLYNAKTKVCDWPENVKC